MRHKMLLSVVKSCQINDKDIMEENLWTIKTIMMENFEEKLLKIILNNNV